MAYSVEDLNPKNPVLKIDDKEIVISLITLNIQVELAETYGSLEIAFKLLQKQPVEIIKLIWVLIKDKSIFDYNFEVYQEFIFKTAEGTNTWAKDMKRCLDSSIYKSMPMIKNLKRQRQIRDMKSPENDTNEICYASYFDIVASRYGAYTLEQFYELTLRQVHIFLKTIDSKKYDELEIQAALLGKKLQPKMEFNDISEEQEEQQEEQAMKALKELQAEYLKNKGE